MKVVNKITHKEKKNRVKKEIVTKSEDIQLLEEIRDLLKEQKELK